MKRQKHYDTAQSIEAEIDKLNESKRSNLLEYAEIAAKISKVQAKMPGAKSAALQQMEYQIEFLLKQQGIVDKRRPLIEQKLLRLKKTHAAFHTVDMFGVQETVLQK